MCHADAGPGPAPESPQLEPAAGELAIAAAAEEAAVLQAVPDSGGSHMGGVSGQLASSL